MALFGFGRKPAPTGAPAHSAAADRSGFILGAARALADLLENKLNTPGRGIRAENVISAAAAVTGEACIRAIGEFDPEAHDFTPGQAVFSDAANRWLCGDARTWETAPAASLFATIRRFTLAHGYAAADFPPVEAVFVAHASHTGGDSASAQARFGRVGLSVPDENWPHRPPLQDAWLLRAPVAGLFERLGAPPAERPLVCAYALAAILCDVKDAIDRGVAARIALETLNGMAKMAPMTPKHWAEIASQANTKTPEG